MYRLGTSTDLWACRENFPEIFLEPFKRNSLKPLGHAMVCQRISNLLTQTSGNLRVLEIGHGAQSPIFQLFESNKRIDLHGLDDHDKDKTVSIEGLSEIRSKYPRVTFHSGYIGGMNQLPSEYFDLVFSVSVIEHVPEVEILDFQIDLSRILKAGGIQLHSYDRPWGGDILRMKRAIEESGFEWIAPPCSSVDNFWDVSSKDLCRIVFEHPFVVMEQFMFNFPREGRELYNWVTVFVGAAKPNAS